MASTNPPPAGAPAPGPAPSPSGGGTTATGAPAPAPAPTPSAGTAATANTSSAASTGATTGGASATTTTTKEKPKKKTTKKKKAAAAADGEGGTTTKKKTVRRKKTPAKVSTSTANNQAILLAAKAAQSDLAQSRAFSAARRTDPLWYRIEDVLPPPTSSSSTKDHFHLMAGGGSSTVLPEQIQIVEAALAHNNMTRSDVTPQAMACLLEQARRFAQELLEDAQDYAAHAGGLFASTPTTATAAGNNNNNKTAASFTGLPEPTPRDYLLAAEMRPDHPQAVTAQLPKLNLLAQQVNAAPLPPIPPQCYSGILLPPGPHLLTARTFDVVSGAHVAQKMIQNPPGPSKAFATSMIGSTASTPSMDVVATTSTSTTTSKSKKSNKPGYGASRGSQIPIQLKKTGAGGDESKPTGTTSGS